MRKLPEKIDLHMHTTVSDGTDTPAALLANVKKAGLELFSMTDHDAVKGCMEVRNMLAQGDPLFLPGAEFSCKDEEGKYHILGYGYKYGPGGEPVQRVVDTGHTFRMRKVRGRLEFLEKQFGVTFPQDELDRLLALDNPGKPHIGNLMVRYGYAQTKEEAIRDYINKVHYPGEYVRPETAIGGILAGGGIPVLAHPFYGSGDQLIVGEEMDGRLRKLIGYGLQGVEAFYSGFTAKLIGEMLEFARKYDLYVTAGSDYHGTNKLVVLGDTNLASTSEGPEGMHRFLKKVLDEGHLWSGPQ